MLEKIELLNKRINKLMTEKAKSDAQREMLEKNLNDSIRAYKEEYGVDLNGENMQEIAKNVSLEVDSVKADVAKAYKKAEKIVSSIENGDIEEAWKLVGGKYSKEEGVDLNKEVQDEDLKEDNKETGVEMQQESLVGTVETIEDMSDDDFYGSDEVSEAESVLVLDDDEEEVKEETKSSGLYIDDEEDDDFYIGDTPVTKDKDDDDDIFGGFGNILNGTKFEA